MKTCPLCTAPDPDHSIGTLETAATRRHLPLLVLGTSICKDEVHFHYVPLPKQSHNAQSTAILVIREGHLDYLVVLGGFGPLFFPSAC
jgi:hypothetical protein